MAEQEILPPERDHPDQQRDADSRSEIWLKFGADDRARFVFTRPSPLALILTWLIVGGVAAAILFLAFGALVIGALTIGAVAASLLLTGALRDVVRRLRSH